MEMRTHCVSHAYATSASHTVGWIGKYDAHMHLLGYCGEHAYGGVYDRWNAHASCSLSA